MENKEDTESGWEEERRREIENLDGTEVKLKYDDDDDKEEEERDDDDEVEEEEEEEEGTYVEETPPTWIRMDDFELYCETPEAVPYFRKLIRALGKDDKDRFVALTSCERRLGTVRKAGIIFHPSLLLFRAITAGAVACVRSILDGEAELGEVDVNRAPNRYYPPPIIAAATNFQPELVDLLDTYKARFDILCHSVPYRSMLPFEAAIEALRRGISYPQAQSWSPVQSINELICSLHDKKQELRTISLVMRKTSI